MECNQKVRIVVNTDPGSNVSNAVSQLPYPPSLERLNPSQLEITDASQLVVGEHDIQFKYTGPAGTPYTCDVKVTVEGI